MTIEEKMNSGRLYDPCEGDLQAKQDLCLEKLYDYNQTRPSEKQKRHELLKEMLGSMGDHCTIEPPFYANWAGKNLFLKDHIYANFGLTCVNDVPIYVGSYTLFGPHVTLAVANHPLDPSQRKQGLQYNRSITIGENCWLGTGVIVLPGVTIGDHSVIGAGSVVTRDIPDHVVAVGNPCRILRAITKDDIMPY